MRLQSNNGMTSDILGASALVSVPPVAQKSSYKSKFFLLVSLQDASPQPPCACLKRRAEVARDSRTRRAKPCDSQQASPAQRKPRAT